MIRRLNAPVVDIARFAELTGKRRPLGMLAAGTTYQLLRETYFDSADGALSGRGMTLKLRAEARGHSVLELAVAEGVNLQGVVEERVLETPIVGGGVYATLAKDSEVATRVREVIEPDALRPRAAVDIDRETRELKAGPLGRATHRVQFDEVIAHVQGAAREYQEVTIVELTRGRTTLEELGARLGAEHGIASDGMDTFRRIQRTLMESGGVARPEVPNDVRVALLVLRDWEVALVEGVDGLALPHALGSGEDIAREYLAELQGRESGPHLDLDLVGFAAARRGGSDLEVWLHEPIRGEEIEGVLWIPLMELMQRLGGPRLRDPGLISTLLMLVRSELGQRIIRDAPHRRLPPVELPVEPRPADLKPGKGADDLLDLELSILDFNQRVLELAEDADLPLLERFRFLSIFASNLDEFFVVRVGRLKDEVVNGEGAEEEDFSPEQLLDIVSVRVRALVARQYACLRADLLPALADAGIAICSWEDLNDEQRDRAAPSRGWSAWGWPLPSRCGGRTPTVRSSAMCRSRATWTASCRYPVRRRSSRSRMSSARTVTRSSPPRPSSGPIPSGPRASETWRSTRMREPRFSWRSPTKSRPDATSRSSGSRWMLRRPVRSAPTSSRRFGTTRRRRVRRSCARTSTRSRAWST
jgi:hypothetical protein